MSEQKPSVGRIVHYMSHGSADGVFESMCHAAIVTDVPADASDSPVALAVFYTDGILFAQEVTYDARGPVDEDGTPLGGTWHWPERV